MTVFLLLYLCADATRTDCQVVQMDVFLDAQAIESCPPLPSFPQVAP